MAIENYRDILKYSPGRKQSSAVKRAYTEWRQDQTPPIPLRCDIPTCDFHTNELIWNDKELKLILDHINGVNGDDDPHNLRFLCPSCNSQQPTTGGGNKGRVTQEQGVFSIRREDGNKETHTFNEEKVGVRAFFDAEVIKPKP